MLEYVGASKKITVLSDPVNSGGALSLFDIVRYPI
jgi:hypothetical protein